MQACCCSLAGTTACMRCRQNNLSNWYTNQQIQQFPSPYYPAQPSPVVPAPVIDYDKLADKIADRLRVGRSVQEAGS